MSTNKKIVKKKSINQEELSNFNKLSIYINLGLLILSIISLGINIYYTEKVTNYNIPLQEVEIGSNFQDNDLKIGDNNISVKVTNNFNYNLNTYLSAEEIILDENPTRAMGIQDFNEIMIAPQDTSEVFFNLNFPETGTWEIKFKVYYKYENIDRLSKSPYEEYILKINVEK